MVDDWIEEVEDEGTPLDHVCIARSINGISLNGLEYHLAPDGFVEWFPTKTDAVQFIREHNPELTFWDIEEGFIFLTREEYLDS